MAGEWFELIQAEVAVATELEAEAYLVGAVHDACFSRMHNTTRFAQKDKRWLDVLNLVLQRLGYRAWTYREGIRDVHVLETSWKPSTLSAASKKEVATYVRGYFDAEGGVPHSGRDRFYVQFVQKDWQDLNELRDHALSLGLTCGRMHNPSKKVDPDYWRFYILAASHQNFINQVGSWHPTKRVLIEARRCPRRVA